MTTASTGRTREEATEPTAMDRHVGGRLRLRRLELGMTLEGLANRLDVRRQQIQKYEGGITRITVGRLYDFATILDIAPGWFFEGYAAATVPAGGSPALDQLAANPEALALVPLMAGMSKRMRQALLSVAQELADASAKARAAGSDADPEQG